MAFNFDEVIDRRHSDSSKWNKFSEDVLPLWVADMDFRIAPGITSALHARIDHGVFGYGSHPDALSEAVIARMKSEFNWQVEASWLVFMPGVVSALNACVRAFTPEGKLTLAPTPIYPPFREAAHNAGRGQINAQLVQQDGRWVMDLNAITAQQAAQTGLLMLCNPQNPGGTVYRRDELEAQLAFAQRHDLVVCSDEIHSELILEPGCRHIPFATLSEEAASRSVTLISPSKTWNIAGLGASVAIIPNPQLRKLFLTAIKGIVAKPDVLALTAAAAAWREGEAWRQEVIAYLLRNRDALASAVARLPGITLVAPEATYLAWIDARELPVDDPTRHFLQHGLGLSPGASFGDKGFVRLNFACTRAQLDEAIIRLERAVNAAFKG